MNEKRYDSINGLRVIAALGIIAMHIAGNTKYSIPSNLYNIVLPQCAMFVFLFMIISGFGMCCGYYDKLKNNKISLNEFYKRRYVKILPFFSILVLMDLLVERNLESMYEGIANLTLTFSFLPNSNISIIGVGWTLGIIFAFYMLFPFFIFLLDNKKRAWFSLGIAIILDIICIDYFFTSQFVLPSFNASHSILYCAIFFIAGGLIYLYRDDIYKYVSKYRYLFLVLCIIVTILYFVFGKDLRYKIIYICFLFSLYFIYTINVNSKFLNNKIITFLSNISLEIYLCHMLIFRIIEKLNLLYIFQNDILSFLISCFLVIIGSIIFSVFVHKMIEKIKHYIIVK